MTEPAEIHLCFSDYRLGIIRFPHVTDLRASRAIDGLVLNLSAEVELNLHEKLIGRPMVSNVRVTVSSFDEEVGIAEDVGVHIAKTKGPLVLPLRLSAAAVRTIEHKRSGGPVPVSLDIEACVSVLRDTPIFRHFWHDLDEHADPVLDSQGQHVVKAVVGEPTRQRDTVRLVLDAISWSHMLKATGFGENVFVEIPLPPSPGPPWDEVWKALRTARDALNRGGTTAWKLAVSECRVALEKWQDIEAVDHGDGGLTANRLGAREN